MIKAGIVKALLSQSGLSIDSENIAQALRSDKTLDKYEAALAADCILKVCHEIKLDHKEENVIKLCLITNLSDAVEIGDPPVFYTALSFLHGCNKSFYEGTMISLTTYSSSI